MSSIVSKVWNFCQVLRDDGVSCVDYIEQITLLIFLKITDEYSRAPFKKKMHIPKSFDWQTLLNKKGVMLQHHYHRVLKNLSNLPGMVGQIFIKAQNKIEDPVKLEKLILMVNQETWNTAGTDLNSDIYEKLIEKMAADTQKGAGQYFTPRALIKVMVECMNPKPYKTIIDPACGTGGFLLGAYDFIVKNNKLNKNAKKVLRFKTFKGNEIVNSTRRLCLMNLFLQDIGDINQKETLISAQDALLESPRQHFDYVFANPPFGRKSSIKITNKKDRSKKTLIYHRPEFWAATSNKQLNFLQHIKSLLKPNGKAAVIVPDNVLFEGGAGTIIRRKLLETTNLHTILRLPTGIFTAIGVKTNVLFFDNKPSSQKPQTKEVWFYDYRTNVQHTLKNNPLQSECLIEFIKCYRAKNRSQCKESWSNENPKGSFRKFGYQEIIARDKCNLDIFWLKDESVIDVEKLPSPQKMVGEVIEGLKKAVEQFTTIEENLKKVCDCKGEKEDKRTTPSTITDEN